MLAYDTLVSSRRRCRGIGLTVVRVIYGFGSLLSTRDDAATTTEEER